MDRNLLVLSLEREGGQELARRETPFAIPGFGQHTYSIDFHMPEEQGKCLLKAAAQLEGATEPALSRRKVTLTGTPESSK